MPRFAASDTDTSGKLDEIETSGDLSVLQSKVRLDKSSQSRTMLNKITIHPSSKGLISGSTSVTMQQSPPHQQANTSDEESSVDQKLVARVQNGDKKAFDLLVVKYQSRVASVISRYISDYHEIADVTQEAFIKAYKALPKFRGDSAFYTWVYRIAINCAKNYLVSKGRRPPATDVDVDEAEYLSVGHQFKDVASPELLLNKQQLEITVKESIAKLPEDLRVALTLREFDGLSYEEIAEVMGCPVGTVRSRIFRAREAVDLAIQTLGES